MANKKTEIKQDTSTSEDERALKNSIFAAREAQRVSQEKLGGISQLQAAQKNYGITLPTGLVPLPSLGLVYAAGHPLSGKEDVEIYGMTAMQEDILTNSVFIKKGTVITELIKSCLVDKSIDVNSLISGDRNALMVAIRVTGYGAEYKPQILCPGCETKQDFMVDLNSLNIKNLEVQPVQPETNAFEFKLPISGKTVLFKFLTGLEEEEIITTMEAKKKRGIQQGNLITNKLFYSIISVDGNEDRGFILSFINYMPAGDSLKLRRYMDKLEPTIEMKSEFICKACDHVEVLGIQLGAEFFWPSAD